MYMRGPAHGGDRSHQGLTQPATVSSSPRSSIISTRGRMRLIFPHLPVLGDPIPD